LKIKVGFAKVGNIGCSPLIEFLLDERAEREDIEVRVFGSGSKMDPESCISIAEETVKYAPHLIVFTSPNASLPGPSKAREIFQKSNIPTIIVSDNPAKKATKLIEEAGLGYIIVEGDVMIGARREFLDPVEMACFNSDIIKVLAVTGALEVLRATIDRLITDIKNGGRIELPRIIVNKDRAVNEAGFNNPYAKAKAASAYEMVRRAGDLTFEGCFVEKDWKRYIELVCAGHEIVRAAAQLADEAREIEKGNDMLTRKPHNSEGLTLKKNKLIEKPSSL